MERERNENKLLKDTLLNASFLQAGIDPHAKGLEKTMRDAYKGEPDVKAIQEWAKENYNWQPPVAPPPEPTEGQILGREIATAQQRIDAGTQGAGSTDPNTLDVQIAEAERAGNFVLSLSLKSQKLAQQLRSRNTG